MSRLKVTNQNRTRICGQRLQGTYLDKMEDNHYCMLLNTVGAAAGAICAGVLAVAAGVAALGVVAAVVGGAFVGSLINRIPCICAMISAPMWTLPHPTVRISGILALPEKALLPCMLGGPVKIMLLDIPKVMAYSKLCDDSYNDVSDDTKIGVWEEETEISKQVKMKDDESGLFARLYKSGDNYVLVFRGTDTDKGITEFLKDAKTDARQALGMKDKQYDKASELAAQINEKLKRDPKTQNVKLELAGHSLGGGEAALAAADNNLEAYTFNAAGVHQNTYNDKDARGNPVTRKENIYAFHAQDRDILNTLQDNRSILNWVPGLGFLLLKTKGLPSAAGQRIGLETDASLLSGHNIEPLRDALTNTIITEKITVKAETI